MRGTLLIILSVSGAVALLPGRSPAAGPVLPLPPEAREELDRLLGPGVVGEALPSAPIADASVYFPLRERAPVYRVTSGSNAGTTQTLSVAKGQRPNGSPAWRMGLSPSMAAFVRQTADGDLVMPAVSDIGEGLIIVTTPPNPFILTNMQPGETRQLTQAVSVNYLDDPNDQDYSGSLTTKCTYVGTYRVSVPAGTYEAVLLRTHLEGKIGPAHTDDYSYYFFASGVGIVAMVSQEDVEAFWIVHIDTSSGRVLAAD